MRRPALDVARTQQELKRFIKTHRLAFDRLSAREPQLLEMASLSIAAEHYARCDYKVYPENPVNGLFKVKTSSKGYRRSFSWFRADGPSCAVEIHGNIGVQSAYARDGGIYVVDVGVVRAGSVSRRGPGKTDEWVRNGDLVTFLEAKHLVAYPMLLAQFLGIVHELAPRFIDSGRRRPRNFARDRHFDPALVTVGSLARTASAIRDGFRDRAIKIQVLTNFDVKISWLRSQQDRPSPLDGG